MTRRGATDERVPIRKHSTPGRCLPLVVAVGAVSFFALAGAAGAEGSSPRLTGWIRHKAAPLGTVRGVVTIGR